MEIRDQLKQKQLRRGNLGSIEQDEFLEVIISLLKLNGGRARRQVVLDQIYQICNSQFQRPDFELLASQNPPKERWIHNVDWAKRKLVVGGILYQPSNSPHGTWVLTGKGQGK